MPIGTPISLHDLSSALLAWYERNRRNLPWRRHGTPYTTWLSEIMLQQTRVDTVIPYYERFLVRFPTVQALAAASLDDVLKLWEGLGYYARARNLHAAAQQIISEYGGRFPETIEEWAKLPGIGRYTAGAIASIALGRDEPALDGNIRRVLCRIFEIREDPSLPATQKRLWHLAAELIASQPGRAGDLNQALMDLGAIVCVPGIPRCPQCPIQMHCRAYQAGEQDHLPVRTPRRTIPHYNVTAGLIWRDEQLLIARRPLRGMLGGLWEFPGGKQEPGEDLPDCLAREIREELGVDIAVGELLTTVQHAYTHLKITLYAYHSRYLSGEPRPLGVADCRWVFPWQLDQFAFPVTDQQVIAALRAENPARFEKMPAIVRPWANDGSLEA